MALKETTKNNSKAAPKASTKKQAMNKVMLIEKIADESGEQKSVCKRIMDTFLELVSHELKAGREIAITNFGVFSASKRKARTGINPVTKKKMSIPAKIVPKFKAGKGLKTFISGE